MTAVGQMSARRPRAANPGKTRRARHLPVALTVRVAPELANGIDAYRRSITPISPTTTAVFRHLLALGLAKAREESGAHEFPRNGL